VFVPRGYGVEAAEEYRDVEDLARRLEGAGGPVFVVVSSSWEAVKLAASLPGRLKLVYLPALYEELVEEGGKRRLAWVSHDGLCTAYEGRVVGGVCKGPAPGLSSLPLEELEAGVEALEALRRSHKNLGEAALRLLLDAAGIISPFGGVATAVKAVYDFFQGAIRRRHGEVAGLLKFVEAAEKARVYVRRLEFEALVDSVALEWGMETGRFKILVEALGDPSLVDWLAHGRHVDSLSKFGRVYARYNAEELGVTDEYVVEAGVQHPLAKKVFVEKAKEVMRLLESNKAAALVGPRGVGKSILAKYVAYSVLMQEQVDYVVVPEGPINVNELCSNAGVGDFSLLRLRGCPTGKDLIKTIKPHVIYFYIALWGSFGVYLGLCSLRQPSPIKRRFKLRLTIAPPSKNLLSAIVLLLEIRYAEVCKKIVKLVVEEAAVAEPVGIVALHVIQLPFFFLFSVKRRAWLVEPRPAGLDVASKRRLCPLEKHVHPGPHVGRPRGVSSPTRLTYEGHYCV
jgi:hypothetical protein